MNKSITKVVNRTFLLWAAILFMTNIVLRVILSQFAQDFILNYIFVTNVISTIFYLTIFVVLIINLDFLKEYHSEKNLVLVWGFILFIILLQSLYVITNVASDSVPPIITGIPIDVIGAAIGTFVSYLLSKKKFFKVLTIINLTVILFSVLFSLFLPIENPLRAISKLVMQYSVLLIVNFIVSGFLYKYDNAS